MPYQQLTESQTRRVIFSSLSIVWKFNNRPGSPEFLDEHIVWRDIFEIPKVDEHLVRTLTLLACRQLDPENYRPRIHRQTFFDHLDENMSATGEIVRDYADFLQDLVVIYVEED